MPRELTTRDEKVAEARRLRDDEGLMFREIAERMGVAVQTVDSWLNDPDLAKQRARRKRYVVACSECGGPTDGSPGYKARVVVCRSCREWTREEAIEKVQAFAREHGRQPTIDDCRAGGRILPDSSTAGRLFGGWNALLVAAGFEIKRDSPNSERMQAIVARVVETGDDHLVAEEFDTTRGNVRQALYSRGLALRNGKVVKR